jgi:hypothetical protein
LTVCGLAGWAESAVVVLWAMTGALIVLRIASTIKDLRIHSLLDSAGNAGLQQENPG